MNLGHVQIRQVEQPSFDIFSAREDIGRVQSNQLFQQREESDALYQANQKDTSIITSQISAKVAMFDVLTISANKKIGDESHSASVARKPKITAHVDDDVLTLQVGSFAHEIAANPNTEIMVKDFSLLPVDQREPPGHDLGDQARDIIWSSDEISTSTPDVFVNIRRSTSGLTNLVEGLSLGDMSSLHSFGVTRSHAPNPSPTATSMTPERFGAGKLAKVQNSKSNVHFGDDSSAMR